MFMYIFWFSNENHKLQFEKWIRRQNIILYMTVTHIWMQKKKLRKHKIHFSDCVHFTKLNQLIFSYIERKKGFHFCTFQIYTFAVHMSYEKRRIHILPTIQIHVQFFFFNCMFIVSLLYNSILSYYRGVYWA